MLFSDFMKSEYSQFGQDGILLELSKIVKNKYFVEFGSSGDDRGMGNTPNLRRHGWTGLVMDTATNPDAIYDLKQERINADNIEDLLAKYDVPKDLGLMSIDIDGQDYWVWKSIINWKPDIVIIESNHTIPLDRSISIPKNNDFVYDGSYYYGASQRALLELGNSKGYDLVAICVVDMIFVRNQLTRSFNFTGVNDIERLDHAKTHTWVPKWVREQNELKEWIEV